jgi:hypothetical protein
VVNARNLRTRLLRRSHVPRVLKISRGFPADPDCAVVDPV